MTTDGKSRTRATCFDKAVDLLSRRSHFRRELERKLSSRSYGESEVEDTLARLVAMGYVDDLQCARDYVEARRRRGGIGRRRLAAELERHGAEQEVVRAVLEAVSDGDDLEAAREAAGRWWRSGRQGRDALARHLERKGFAGRAILCVLEEGPQPPGSESWTPIEETKKTDE